MADREEWTLEVRKTTSGDYEYVVHLSDDSRSNYSWGWSGINRLILFGTGVGQGQVHGKHGRALKIARLISAAPDLLVACEKAENWLVASVPGGHGAPVRQLRAAIAKAKGDANV